MKFVPKSLSKCAPRLGVLTDIEHRPNFKIESPFAMLYTRGGSIPHITHEVYEMCCKESQIIQIPTVSTYQFQEPMTSFKGTISDFVGLKDCVSCITVQDPGDLTKSGHHFKNHVPIWTRSGKILLSGDKYMDLVESFKPDMYHLISDGDTNISSTQKRCLKSVDITLKLFETCMERHKKSDVLAKSFVVASISGGYCLKSRKMCIDEIGKSDFVGGFLIDGLHNNGPEVELLPFDEVQPVVEYVVNTLPSEKSRSIFGCWNPVSILKLVKIGIDIFDTSYCHIVTERSSALTFATRPNDETQIFEINLKQSQFIEDLGPILPGCDCLTCSKYSRSYICHLVTVHELLGPILLTIHNLHHYMKFFEEIRKAIANGTLQDLEDLVFKQFDEHVKKVPNRRD